MKKLLLLAKIFENAKYMQEFLEGKLYMNSLAYFKNIEINNDQVRYDSDEGLSCFWQPENCSLELNGHLFGKNNFVAPTTIYPHANNYKNIFCMWSISSENDALTNIHIDEKNKSFGEHLVVITSPKEFLEKIKIALQDNHLKAQSGLVKYYDKSSHQSFNQNEELFNKVSDFSYQQEYRIVIDTNLADTPYELKIGSLQDISMTLTIDEFNKNITLENAHTLNSEIKNIDNFFRSQCPHWECR